MQKNIIVCPIKGITELLPYDFQEIEPLLSYLKKDELPSINMAFPRGTITDDGRLDLCKQSLGPEGCSFVVESLWNNTRVKSLLLGTDGIGNGGAEKVAQLIGHNENLETIYLGCNLIENEGTEKLAQALITNTSVRGLWLKRNPIGEQGAYHIANVLKQNRHLRTLDLVNTQIGTAGLKAICEVLATQNQTLERLYLGGNQINAEGASYLAEVLRQNKTLKALLLSVNELGDKGGTILAEALADNTTLEELGLASCGLGENAMVTLFTHMATNNSIHSLDLGYSISTRVMGASANHISDRAARALKKFLEENKTVISLKLNRTGMTKFGKARLREGMATNTYIQELTITGKKDPQLQEFIIQNQSSQPKHNSIPEDVKVIKSVYR
ncbi:hypothetical protein [Xanthocytophaga agilis]|uniref:Uncharacterized protein n=1 Tax=Xanthocytophaga agilis TaxID=3048010 RepID=A0AAE3R9V1_9BACT|nr:hypothetical protein [Xanthocytophaga agilis]MDJ1506591.1 hypothetical protein [Xanthocytophaga agilis]